MEGPVPEDVFFGLSSIAPGVRPVRRLALGTAYLPTVERAEAVATLHRAWGQGFELVDTAPLYGQAEAILAECLEAWPGERPVVATKTLRTEAVAEVAERYRESRERLGPIDLLAVHDASPRYPAESRAATAGFLSERLSAGEIQAAGLGGGGPVVQAQWLPAGIFRYIITHLRLDALTLQGLVDTVPQARQRGAAIFAASPMHVGLLGPSHGKLVEDPPPHLPPVLIERARVVQRLADEWGLPLTQLAVRFVLSLPMVDVVLSGAATREAWADCQAAYEAGPLPSELYSLIWHNARAGAEPAMGG